jgi:ABC-type transport system involved in cytochrome c biogenesis permease subunit
MWKIFELYALISIVSWGIAMVLLAFRKPIVARISDALVLLGIISLSFFIVKLWMFLDRPPLRTLGETRLWYSLFISCIGYVLYKRWNYRLFLAYALLMALVFMIINYAKPDIHDKALMPALQSVWFVPHVIVYIVSYAFLGFSCLLGIIGLYQIHKGIDTKQVLGIAENIIYIGFGFLTLGLLFGALWAKEAWGHYWTWDPKETWALLTWGVYIVYMHLSLQNRKSPQYYLWFITLSFTVLLIAWFGINYLPAAQMSVHVYSN